MSQNFVGGLESKLVMNMGDVFNTNNIGGFNISNFKLRFLQEFLDDVVSDYESSFIGSFIQAMFVHRETRSQNFDLFMSVTKFDQDFGYSLLKGDYQQIEDSLGDLAIESPDGYPLEKEQFFAASTPLGGYSTLDVAGSTKHSGKSSPPGKVYICTRGQEEKDDAERYYT